MNKRKLKKIEDELEKKGYRKFTSCLSSKETYGWFKSVSENTENENSEDELLYQIEFRVWDWSLYGSLPDDIGLDVLIIISGEGRIDLELSHIHDISTVEKTAKDFYLFCKERGLLGIRED